MGIRGVSTAKHTVSLSTRDSCIIEVVPTGSVKELRLSEDVMWLKQGEQQRVIAEVLPVAAIDKTVTWNSQKENIATVDGSGYVAAVQKGFTEVICTTNNRNLKQYTVVIVADTKAEYDTTLQEYYDSIDPWHDWDNFFDENMGWLNGVVGIGGSYSLDKLGNASGMFVMDGYGNLGFVLSISNSIYSVGIDGPKGTGSLMIDWGSSSIRDLGFVVTDINKLTVDEILKDAIDINHGGSITVKHITIGGDFTFGDNGLPSSFTLNFGLNSIPIGFENHTDASVTVVIPFHIRYMSD